MNGRKQLLNELADLDGEGLVKGCFHCGMYVHIKFWNDHLQNCKEVNKLR